MKTETGTNTTSLLVRQASKLGLLGIFAFGLAVTSLGCKQGQEGDRCNPYLSKSDDECNGGLVCTAATDLCPENYCCPADGKSDNPYCQPGCNGGAAAICLADPTADAACKFAADHPDGG
jgi:hypothetical protein